MEIFRERKDIGVILTCMILALYCPTGSSATDSDIAVHPSNASVTRGNYVMLDCQFKQPGKCFWFKDGDAVALEHYGAKFIHHHDGPNYNPLPTRYCSIIFATFTPISTGYWQCSSGSEPESARAYLTLGPDFAVQPSNATVTEGSNVILRCKPNVEHVMCSWERNGTFVETGYTGRIRFLAHRTYSPETDSCSITIENFTRVDVGDWQCVLTKAAEKFVSTKAYLTLASGHATTTSHVGMIPSLFATLIELLSVITMW